MSCNWHYMLNQSIQGVLCILSVARSATKCNRLAIMIYHIDINRDDGRENEASGLLETPRRLQRKLITYCKPRCLTAFPNSWLIRRLQRCHMSVKASTNHRQMDCLLNSLIYCHGVICGDKFVTTSEQFTCSHAPNENHVHQRLFQFWCQEPFY